MGTAWYISNTIIKYFPQQTITYSGAELTSAVDWNEGICQKFRTLNTILTVDMAMSILGDTLGVRIPQDEET